MRFGEFLRHKGVLDADGIATVLAAQDRTNVWIGTLAYVLGYLDFDQICQTLAAQHRGDQRLFGEIAVALGFLTPEQLDRLVDLQRKKRVRFGEVAVALQYLQRDELARYLDEYGRVRGT